MNVNYSTTRDKTLERLTNKQLTNKWNTIDWKNVEKEVNKLQVRIAKAMQNKKYNDVKRLQYLLTHSFNAKALAVRKVTTNKGKNTAGVDKELWSTPAMKMKATLNLTDKNYKAKPLKRVFIEKKGKKSLGIPTMYDRAMQELYALALEPVAEVTADTKSFGFRKGRYAQDACEYIFTVFSRKYSPKWILEGDIKGCFDNISYQWLMENIPMDKSILKEFLKAGFIFKDKLFPTDNGNPQGGIISPILANIALDGIQGEIDKYFHTNLKGNIDTKISNINKVDFVRYADNFIVTADNAEIAMKVKKIIKEFLKTRGLELSEEKTFITHINYGFDFIGWTFKKFDERLIVKPSKKSIKSFVSELSNTILGVGKAWKQEVLIEKLNIQIREWTNYHQSVVSNDFFSHIDYVLFNLLYRWAKRRHPKKAHKWIIQKYWRTVGTSNWVFATEKTALLRVDYIAIVRHKKVRMNANPYFDVEYFKNRNIL